MPFVAYTASNEAKWQFLIAVGASGTSWILKTGQGWLFPSTFPFKLKAEKYDSSGNVIKREFVKCTARTWDTLTVVRSHEACPADYLATTQTTTAFAFDADDWIFLVHTADSKADQDAAIAWKVDTTAYQNQSPIFATSTGSANAYLLNLSPAPVVYTTGMKVSFSANFGNTGACTINVNGLGAKTIKKLGGSTDLVSGDIALGMIVECVYDGTNFEMLTPTAPVPQTDINGTASYTTQSDNDAFITYNTGAGANRKETRSQMAKTIRVFWGDTSDGTIDGTANITITGSNDTIIERNYTSWAAGGAARACTITPTRCITIIRIKWDANFTNWTFDFAGKGGQGDTVSTSWAPSVFFVSTGGTQTTGASGQWGAGGGASCLTNGQAGITGHSPWGVTAASFSTTTFRLLKQYRIDCGAAGGRWRNSGSYNLAGGHGGGCLIIEVGWNLTWGTGQINANGANGVSTGGATSGDGGSGGGGGGSVLVIHGGTLTGTPSINVNGGTGGNNGVPTVEAGSGGVGQSLVIRNTFIG